LICSARFTAGHGNLLSIRLNADLKGDYSQPGLMPGRYLEQIDVPSAYLVYAVGNRLRRKLQLSPGSAPILEAEADIWVVRANAYTQSALAELMRTRGIDLANQSKTAKLGAANGTSTNGLVTGALTNR